MPRRTAELKTMTHTKQIAGIITALLLAPSAGQWQEVAAKIVAEGPLGILRVYLLAQRQTVDVDWIEIRAADRTKRWEF